MSRPGDLRFLCDEMLSGLGRWLRIAGYDTALAGRGDRDRDLVEQAIAERRVLLTRDHHVTDIRGAQGRTLVLQDDGIDACAVELARLIPLDWNRAPFSRCSLCNVILDPASPSLLADLPRRVRDQKPVRVCPGCKRIYWEGSHVHRMRQRLLSFAAKAAEATPSAGEREPPRRQP